MKRIILGLGACLMGFAMTGEAQANGRPVVVRNRVVVTARAYHLQHGVAFRGGYYFVGRNHNHWSQRVWEIRGSCEWDNWRLRLAIHTASSTP